MGSKRGAENDVPDWADPMTPAAPPRNTTTTDEARGLGAGGLHVAICEVNVSIPGQRPAGRIFKTHESGGSKAQAQNG